MSIKKVSKPRQLNIKIPDQELNILNGFSQQSARNKTDIIREFIRSLESQVINN
jgi:hypothetical protein